MKGTEMGVLVDEFVFDGATSKVEITFDVPEQEATNLASSGQEFEPFPSKMQIAQTGYFEGIADGSLEKELNRRLAKTGVIVTALVGKSATPCIAYSILNCANMTMKFGAPMDNLVTLDGAWGVATNPRRGKRIYSGTLSAIGTTPSVDYGAGAYANGGWAILHVTGIAGAASGAQIVVESSANGTTGWTAEATFTVSAKGAYALALVGSVDRYLRVNLTNKGGATSLTFQAIVSLT